MSKKTLILGGSSYIGRNLLKKMDGRIDYIATYNVNKVANGVKLDILESSLSDNFDDLEIFNHAIFLLADPDPNSCFADKELSRKLNVLKTQKIIDELAAAKIHITFMSSEFVHDGKKGNYFENEDPNPILLYGRQKLEIEQYLREKDYRHTVFRLAKTYGDEINDKTLFSNWLNNVKKNGMTSIKCASDQVFSPIFLGDVTESLCRVVESKKPSKLINLAGPKAYSRLELLNILITCIREVEKVNIEIEPCSILDFPLKEPRPLNVSMNSNKLQSELGIKLNDPEAICRRLVSKAYNMEE